MPSAFGRIVAAPTVERGVEVTLRYLLPTYLGVVLAQAGYDRDALADPTNLVRQSEFDWPTETDVALVVVATPGTTGDAERGPETYDVVWDVRAAVLVDFGSDRLGSREASQFYAAAAGAALAEQGCAAVGPDGRTWLREADGETRALLEGSSVRWVGETYRQLGERDGRSLVAGEARLTVTVEDARPVFGPDLSGLIPEPGSDVPPREDVPAGDPAPVDPHVTLHRDP